MSADNARYTLEVAFNENVAGVFTVDGSALDGLDGLTDVGLFDGTFDDVTDDMQDPIQVVVGTDNQMGAVQPANLTVTVARVDEPDYWNPNNPVSPLNTPTPGFTPMRPVRFRAIADGVAPAPLAVSGNEITDATRATNIQGDGLSNDSSFGIWEATTNLCTNGGFETNTNSWVPEGANTIARSQAVTAKFGSWCALCTKNNGVGGDGNCGAFPLTLTAAIYTASAWLWIPSAYTGASVEISVEVFTGATGTTFARADLSKRDQWQRVSFTFTPVSGDLTGSLVLRADQSDPAGLFFYADGVQVEQQPFATPYVHTNGAAATRNAARVQAPTSLLGDGTQFWIAFHVRYGWNAADRSAEVPWLFDWRTDINNSIDIAYLPTTSKWEIKQVVAGAQTGFVTVAAAAVRGGEATVVFQVTATQFMASVNGAAFASAARGGLLAPSGAMFDIGTLAGAGANVFDGDVLWFACGTGTLTDQDAAWLHSELEAGREPWPADINDRSADALCTAVMPFDDATYLIRDQTYGVFRGFIRHATWQSDTRGCELYCEDLLLWASRVFPVIESTGPTNTGAVVALLFKAVDPTVAPVCDDGIPLDDFSADGSQSVTEILSSLLAVDLGMVYVDGDGVPRYEQHDTPLARPAAATIAITSQTSEEQSGIDLDQIVTRATVEKTDPVTGDIVDGPVTVIDPDSERHFGRGDAASVSSPYVHDADALANELVYVGSTGKIPVQFTLANVDRDTLQLILAARPNLVYGIVDDFGGTSGDAIAQQLTHTITTGLHEIEYLCAARPNRAFTVDDSALDGPDTLRYP